jgi:hypothetical protein
VDFGATNKFPYQQPVDHPLPPFSYPLNHPPNDPLSYPSAPPSPECLEPIEIGTCKGFRHEFFFNPISRMCQQFVYSGCSVSRNHFPDANQCIHRCRARDIVYLPPPVHLRQTFI